MADREPGRVTEVLLVIDATTGQNGLVQAREFQQASGANGIVLTKLDVLSDTGAYGNHGSETLAAAMASPIAAYRCENKKGLGVAVYGFSPSTSPADLFSSPAHAQVNNEVKKVERPIGFADIVERVVAAADQAFQAKLDRVGTEQFTPFMRMVLLQSIDSHWREHLAALDHLRQGIHLRGYAQKQPKQEYKREAFELFSMLLDLVKNEVTRTLMTVQIQTQEEADRAAMQMEERAEHISNVTYSAPTETGEVQTTAEIV